MASSRRLIASQTLSSAASSVTFSGIPNTYTDLVLRVSARGDYSGSTISVYVYPNGTGTNTSFTRLDVLSGTISSGRFSGSGWVTRSTGLSYTSDTFGSGEIYLPNYTASTNKPISAFGVGENNSASTYTIGVGAGLWSNTSAITSLLIDTQGAGNFVSGSSFFLYGLLGS